MRPLYFLKLRTGKLNEGLRIRYDTVCFFSKTSSLPLLCNENHITYPVFLFASTSKFRGIILARIRILH